MEDVVLLNNEFLSRSEAAISVDDGAFLHGAGLFETMRAEQGRVFRLEQHVQRLMNSAERLLFPLDRGRLPSAEQFVELLRRNGVTRGRVRLTVSAGSVRNATGEPNPTICSTAGGSADYPEEFYRNGVAVLISRCRVSPSDPVAGHKTTNYLPRLLALREAQTQQCAEALWFTTENLLAEGSISNVFVVKGGTVLTPRLETPVLPGIARAVVLELCREASIPTDERALSINDLLDADEVFLTNSVMQVMPVIRVERKDIAEGRPGPVARQLLAAYRECVAKECGEHA
ncbi:MAG: aminotransferase class IV family protein [Phycisphaerae bacterium]|nr:aminotransferase class IV family protein [Phycisphaerae bacterium]